MKQILLVVVCMILVLPGWAQYRLYDDGLDLYKKQEYAKAIEKFNEYFTKPARDKKIDLEVYYCRALAYYKTEKLNDAIADFEQCINLEHPNSGNIHWFSAKCYDKQGKYDKAVVEYTRAVSILAADKNSKTKLLFERGLAYESMNNKNAAYDDLLIATSLNPDDQSIKEALDRVAKAKGITNTDVARNDAGRNTHKDNKKKEEPKPVQKDPVRTQEETVAKADDTKKNTQPVTPQQTPAQSQVDNRLAMLQEMYAGEKRYALVIGNGSYPKEIGALRNPVNDATDIAKELRKSNFEVELLTNATYIQMREAMRQFHEKLTNGPKDQTVGLFYFAGHGVQLEDENYLVPLDATVEFEDDIARMCFPVQRIVLANMERSNSRMNIVILDACRNNPFPAASRSMGQGLGEMKRARGSFIAFATAPGSIASDGNGRNGLYTQELLKALRKPGLTIEQVFKDVRSNVLRLSGDKQNTWDSSNIVGDFYFRLTDN